MRILPEMTQRKCITKNNKCKSPRSHRISFMVNDDEINAMNRYLRKYRISNKSNWLRTTVMTHVLKVLMEDYPTLFEEKEMRP